MITRNFFLFLSQNKFVKTKATKWGPKLGAKSVIAGETIDEAMKTVRKLNERGLTCTVDHLGEFVYNREEAIESAEYCIRTLDAIAETGVDCNLSLKLTQLGLDVDRNLCRDNMMRILETAEKHGNFVRIDMEDYSHLDATLELLHELRRRFDNVGTAIQAYLYRADKDLRELKGTNIRLIKGAYKESPEVAYQKQAEVDRNYFNIIKTHLLNGSYAAIATHDHQIIDQVKAFAKENGISKDQFEFQMLYGFRSELQNEIAKEGYKMRVYVPFGEDWYGYFMRRLAERPQNVTFAIKGLLSK
ncbi:proline dehydrogenase family protein [Salipaludibacillus aurantiacus]|uniref:proline dehydrogenase n=1 Tax=Salipaludibacillus aurantiacus TaxID=1601833 RepID=A0A1H9WRK8_9BACI|nr:proline dehydrogenase [Salipaludibacillus aurantiacus]SES36419.1 proline dehydrogenase [Salipaludibacillus aurantiacus]